MSGVQWILPAAGMGTRLGAPLPKALVELEGKPLLVHTLQRIAPLAADFVPIVLAPAEALEDFEAALACHGAKARVLPGGAERQDSVRIGLEAASDDVEIVAIHDAARCLVQASYAATAIDAARECGGATVAVPVVDTILVADDEGFLQSTPDRSTLWACQTPQVFRYEVIMEAHRLALAEGFAGTDDATLVRRCGGAVKLVEGAASNIKVTRPEDLTFARQWLSTEA